MAELHQAPRPRVTGHPQRASFKPYTWGGIPGPVIGTDAEIARRADRDAEPDVPERCEACGYLMTSPGHQIQCEGGHA